MIGESMAHELVLVMPVYNEEQCIADVVRSWYDQFTRLGIDFRMLVLNDGSRDNTADALAVFHDDEKVEVIHKMNSGHGPTILVGYQHAVKVGRWVFQCDSDDEMKPDHFSALWERRGDYDALFGMRSGREQNTGRRFISASSRALVGVLFGQGIADVNTPYRLIRSKLLERIILQIPTDTFAPNVIISGALVRASSRIYNHPVPHEHRRTGTVSIVKWKLWRSVVRAFWQTLWCRPSVDVKRP